MARVTRKLAALAIAIALAAPAAAFAAYAHPGSYYNSSMRNGLWLVTSKHTIRTLHLYCVGRTWFTRGNRYEVRSVIPVRRDGSFSYRGTADRYGPEGEWLAVRKVRLSGRFTS